MAKTAGKRATAADAEVCMKFYDLRREAEMRKARNWFGMWQPQSLDDFLKISMDFKAQENAWFRMVVSYWENGATLILRGAVNKDLFMDWNHEMIFVYTKLKPWLKQLREYFKMPAYLEKLETCCTSTPELRKDVANMEQRFKEWGERMRAAQAAKA
jgi:hypothetical protein